MKVVVFDFDGVIVPSEEIKIEGYSRIFSEFGEDVPTAAIAEAREEFSNARGNRFDVIRSILRRTRDSADEEEVQKYAERYGSVVKSGIKALSVSGEVTKVLEKLSEASLLYINSNNPDEPLQTTMHSLGIAKHFKGVFGSSRSKAENLRAIAGLENVTARDMVFVGDGYGDLKAAEAFGCEFIGVATGENNWQETDKPFRILSSLGAWSNISNNPMEKMI